MFERVVMQQRRRRRRLPMRLRRMVMQPLTEVP